MKSNNITPKISEAPDNLVDVTRKRIRRGPSPRTIQKRAYIVLDYLSCHRCELSIVLCDDAFIHHLNQSYRNKDAATDVLSFPLNDAPLNAPVDTMLGDIIISVDTANRQAAELGGKLLDEVTSLLVHGILHLMGHTHDNHDNEKKMNTLAMQILKLF